MKEILKEQMQSENAIVVAVCVKKSDNIERKLDEIERLSFSAGLNVVNSFYQIIKDYNKSTVITLFILNKKKIFVWFQYMFTLGVLLVEILIISLI